MLRKRLIAEFLMTRRKLAAIIVQQDHQLDEWVTVNHMAVPIVMFERIQSLSFEKGHMKGAQYILDFVTSYVRVCIRLSSIRR